MDLTPIMDDAQQQKVQAFLQNKQPGVAHGYESSSSGIIEMLEGLLDKFIGERTDLEKDESASKHAYNMLMQDLKAQVENAKQAVSDKSGEKAGFAKDAGDAKEDKKSTSKTKDEDEKFLKTFTATCETKASDFEQNQQLRADELEAIAKAVEILSGDSVAGAADKHLPTMLIQVRAALRGKVSAIDKHEEKAMKAISYLQFQANKLNSNVLSLLTNKVNLSTGSDPFKKVKQMIQDLIARLLEQANEEAEHKGFCDAELSENEKTRNEKTATVEELHAGIDKLEASIATLAEEITEASEAVTKLTKDMDEATKLRTEESDTNKETISDAQQAQTAVAQATQVLKEFYAKAAEAKGNFLQVAEPEGPEVYNGMQSENGGVVGMLEVIASDFARLESDTKSEEASAQKEYDEFMTDSKVDKASKEKDIEHKTAKKQDENQALEMKKQDLEGTQKELDAALKYFDKLKPQCISTGTSYAERVQKREEEIQSLQEALKILSEEEI